MGLMIRAARLERNMTAQELAERAGVSRPLLSRVEKGDMTVSLGAVFEIATILGVPLFEEDDERLTTRLATEQRTNALLRQRAFQASRRKIDNDF
nr:helix-turn-helix transcriptional regulator [Sulfitobacter pontiacus]